VVESAEVAIDEHLVVFRIEASHYLWRMVRRVTGVLVKVGKGEVDMKEFGALLEGKENPKFNIAAWTAPASGLFLEGIRYGSK
jgi:tRNA pseudouridine38-40 synthase